MILIDKPKLKFLQAGRQVTITTSSTRTYRKGRSYAAGVKANHTLLRVFVIKAVPTDDGVELTICASAEDEIRLLGKNGGYVSDPAQALRREPEAVDRATAKRLVALGTARWQKEHQAREDERLARTLAIRLKDAQRRGDAMELTRVHRELGKLIRRQKEAA